MNMTKSMIINKTNEVGTYFFVSFKVDTGVAVGTRFHTDNATRTWIVGRIDNVTVVDDLIHVEGRCIPVDLEISQ
jgi:hypothetical protein